MLERDVRNMTNYYGQFAPDLLKGHYAKEIWKLFEDGKLTPDSKLTGVVELDTRPADVDSVMLEIKAAFKEQEERLQRLRDAAGDD
jgi:RIO kinase 1